MVDPLTRGQRRRWIGSGDLFEVRAVEDGHCWIRYDGGSRMSYLAGDIMKLTKVVPVLPPLPEPRFSNVYPESVADPYRTLDLVNRMADGAGRIAIAKWVCVGYVDTEGNDLP